ERAKERRLQRLGILLEAADEVLGDEGRGLLREEYVAVDEVEDLDREILETLVADQEDDGKIEAAPAHEVDEGGSLAFEALLAPVDHHAPDRGVGLDRDLGILDASRPDHLEAGALDLVDDLIEPYALEIILVEGGCREQEVEASEVVHHRLRPCPARGVGAFHDSLLTAGAATSPSAFHSNEINDLPDERLGGTASRRHPTAPGHPSLYAAEAAIEGNRTTL